MRPTAGALRAAGDAAAALWRQNWTATLPLFGPDPSKPHGDFYADCAKTDSPWKNFEADHVWEIQLGGDPKGPFLWLDKDVNGASGRQIYNKQPASGKVDGFSTKNCT